MKCTYKINPKKTKKCNKDCLFFYCKVHWWDLLKRKWLLFAAIATGISLIIGLWQNIDFIKDKFGSSHEKFMTDRYIVEILSPYNPYETGEYCVTDSFCMIFPVPKDGNYIDSTPLTEMGCSRTFVSGKKSTETPTEWPFQLTIQIKKNKLYLSLLLRDLKTREIITEIENNKYIIDKLGIKNYYSDDHTLEVKDRYGFIVFRLWVDDKKLQLRGYFAGEVCTLFLTDSGISILDNVPGAYTSSNASILASQLKPMFIK